MWSRRRRRSGRKLKNKNSTIIKEKRRNDIHQLIKKINNKNNNKLQKVEKCETPLIISFDIYFWVEIHFDISIFQSSVGAFHLPRRRFNHSFHFIFILKYWFLSYHYIHLLIIARVTKFERLDDDDGIEWMVRFPKLVFQLFLSHSLCCLTNLSLPCLLLHRSRSLLASFVCVRESEMGYNAYLTILLKIYIEKKIMGKQAGRQQQQTSWEQA